MVRVLTALMIIVAAGVVAIVGLRLAFPLPTLEGRSETIWQPPSEATRIGAALLPAVAAHPRLSGVIPLADGRDAFGARLLMARAAEATIDAQYYIWQDDTTGWMLLDELRAAAARGVRVRLLLDDNGIAGLDEALAALNAMPNAEVRLFNPFTLRRPKLLSYAFDFPRLNRRMHNKSMTVDGIVSVIGGRNIGDIYFAYGEGVHYFDLDALAVGRAAGEVSANFDRYWNSRSAYPAERILPRAPDGLPRLEDAAAAARRSVVGSPYVEAASASPLLRELVTGQAPLQWVTVRLFSDEPEKALGRGTPQELLISRLFQSIEPPASSLDLVSAYFIPGERGTELLTGFAERGVATRILTNSLEATDVPPVHGAYMRYRPKLVDAGVKLLELRAGAGQQHDFNLSQLLAGSASSLHAKSFAVDGERIFIGSFNFDPRSATLNTEMGFLIDSPQMARTLGAALDVNRSVYRLRRGADGDLEWLQRGPDGEDTLYRNDPNTGPLKRAFVGFIGWLPMEWML